MAEEKEGGGRERERLGEARSVCQCMWTKDVAKEGQRDGERAGESTAGQRGGASVFRG